MLRLGGFYIAIHRRGELSFRWVQRPSNICLMCRLYLTAEARNDGRSGSTAARNLSWVYVKHTFTRQSQESMWNDHTQHTTYPRNCLDGVVGLYGSVRTARSAGGWLNFWWANNIFRSALLYGRGDITKLMPAATHIWMLCNVKYKWKHGAALWSRCVWWPESQTGNMGQSAVAHS